MNLNELHSFKLSDAIKFHTELNPKLWKNDQLDPLVKKQLLIIAEDFVEELGIADLDVVDITISGSNAAFTYTKHSDLDLHILVNMSELHQDAIYRELFRAKKTLYNDTHDITVHGIPVELYVQDSAEPVVSLGEYSILHDKWIKIPKRRSANLDQNATKAKFEQLKDLIDVALKTKHSKKISKALQLIRRYRQAGLDKGGEFSPENLAYKAVRSQGAIDALYAMRDKLHSAELTIEEDIRLDEDDMLAEELRKEFEGYSGPRGKSSSPIGQIKTLTARDIKGKYTDDQLIALGFKKDLNGNFTIPLLKWNKLRSTKQVEDYDPNGKPPGPEFKPTMPAGTVKVGVSDVYDWYKLGQHVSNLKGLGKHDFGQGPPSTIMAFGSEPEEHKYIKDLEKTGLTTTDIDPLDRNQPKGMKRQKTDPTYNVDSYVEDLDEALDSTAVDHIATAINKFAQDVGVVAELRQLPEAEYPAIELTDLYAERPGAGNGSTVMIELARMADEAEINVYVHPEQPRNNEFYARFGFEKDRQHRGMMVRYPAQESEDLDEALDSQPYPYEEIPAEYKSQKLFRFKTDKDLTYLVSLHDFQSRLGISFALQKGKFQLSTDIENTGDARKVFATVIDIVKKYVNATKPVKINFTADEPSRMRLYDAFIKRLDRELPDYTGRQDGEGWYSLKRKTEDLDEALDSTPYPYEQITPTHRDYTASRSQYVFTTNDNLPYLVTLFNYPGNRSRIEFKSKKQTRDFPDFGVTGSGDARKVFATVIEIVKKFVGEHHPVEISFSAKEPSRVRLYNAFMKRLDRELPDYEGKSGPGYEADNTYFYLKLKKPPLDETTDRDSAIQKIKKLQNTQGRSPGEIEASKMLIAKLMKRHNINPKELRPVERNPYQDRINQARAERDVAGDMLKAEWDKFKHGIKDKVSNVVLGPTFKKKMFETVLDYHRFLLCPKDGTDNLHNCRRHPLKQYSTLNEDTVASREARTFADTIMSMGSPIDIVEGGKLALIHTMAMPDNKIIDIYGFTNPKTIEKIYYEDNGEIEYIKFDNGDTYPDQGELVNIGGINITNTIMFNDKSKAEAAYTKLWFTINKMEGLGWKVKSALVETAKINEDEDWHTDPMKWHGGRDDPDWYDMYKTEPLKVKVRLWRGTGTYIVRNFEKISPTKAEITYKRDGILGSQRIDFDNISTYTDRQGYRNDEFSFYCGSMPITARQAFNLFQTKLHTPQTKAPKQKITWTPVDESLDSTPYPYEIEEDSITWQISKFTTSDRNRYKVFISKSRNKEVDLEFEWVGNDDKDVEAGLGIYDLGDSRKVFATIIKIVQDYVKKYKPNMISFTAEEPSRRRLYSALVNRVDRALPDYEDQSADFLGDFHLVRKGYGVNESSGYIPSKKEANDPRFKTALTVDVKPDSIMKNAKAFGSKTSRAGIPPTARADGKI